MYCFQLWHLLPSSVKVTFSLGGPYPAEVLALTEMLYGMYVPAQNSNVMLQTIGGSLAIAWDAELLSCKKIHYEQGCR